MPQSSLFEFLNEGFLSLQNVEGRVYAWERSALIDFLVTVAELSAQEKFTDNQAPAPYRFEASSELSGLKDRCYHPECRLKNSNELAMFATLYADEVYVANPFAEYDLHHSTSWIESASLDFLRESVVGDLKVLLNLKPLFEANILKLRGAPLHYCRDCRARITTSDSSLHHAYLDLEDELHKIYLEDCVYFWEAHDDEIAIRVEGDPHLVGHSSPVFIYSYEEIDPAKHLSRSFASETPLPADVVEELSLTSGLVEPLMSSITMQTVNTRLHGSTFVSSRPLEIELIGRFATRGSRGSASSDLLSGLKHAVPNVFVREIKDLIRIREMEAESFAAYRAALSEALAEAQSADIRDLPTIISDIVTPEVNQIRLRLKTSKTTRRKRLRNEIIIGSGSVAIGLLSAALIPNSTILSGALTTAGATVLTQALSQPQTESEVVESPYAFLWQAGQID